MSVFSYLDYRDFLIERLGGQGKRTGLKSKLAAELEIKNSYLSRILAGGSDFTPEQGFLVTKFLGLNELETDFFLELVAYSRASHHGLKSLHKKNIVRLAKESKELDQKLKDPNRLSQEDAFKYYSKWIYLAVHVAVSLPSCQRLEDLERKFDLPRPELEEVLVFLESAGIIHFDPKMRRYGVGDSYTHMGKDSELTSLHHYNWRIKSLEQISKQPQRGLHYSGVFSLSKKDALVLKENFIDLINNHIEIIKPSKEETMVCQVIDLFEI